MVIHLTLKGALEDHLRQPAQQPALTGKLHPAGAGPLGELAQQLLIHRRQHRLGLVPVLCHVSHLVSPPSLELHR